MKVGWLHDGGNADGTQGGAELTQAEFKAAAPDGVEIVDCPTGGVVEGLDRYVVHNCVTYRPEDVWPIEGRAVKYLHDVWPHGDLSVKASLLKSAKLVCCSPLQRDRLGLSEAEAIPPPVDLARFRAAARENGSERRGAIAVGPWMNHGKAPHLAAEWAKGNGGLDFVGGGPLAPAGSFQVPYESMPALFTKYRTFVHLPTVLEPFGRTVVEAWAAGCQIVTNRLVGARWWIEEQPEALETAAEDFWKLVLA